MDSIQEIKLPSDSLVARAFPYPDYIDAFCASIPCRWKEEPGAAARVFLQAVPAWGIFLMRFRDFLARIFGLKPAGEGMPGALQAAALNEGDDIGFFHVYTRSSNEILLGKNDRHLDFRLSILILPAESECLLAAATVVRFNSVFGRIYFAPVRFFHRILVKRMLANASRRLRQS